MSKLGRKPISLTSAKVEIKGNLIHLQGPKGKFTHEIPMILAVAQQDNNLVLSLKENTREGRMLWGLHRALLVNKVKGVETGFETALKINGLGFKAQVSGKKIVLTLGFSHKIDYQLPDGVEASADKTGQTLVLNSVDKFLLGKACDEIRAFRPPEPYKGTGIKLENEVVRRKAGKAKTTGAA